jgi:Domain of unknown function (DUF4333)
VPRRLLVLTAPFLLTGCSVFGSAVLSAEEVATQTEEALEEQVGVRPEVTCPDDLDAEVGAETRCVLTAGGDPTEYGVTVRVESVDGGKATFDVQVDEEPLD